MVGHGGSSAGSSLADPTSPIPSHCTSIVATRTVRVNLLPLQFRDVIGRVVHQGWRFHYHLLTNEKKSTLYANALKLCNQPHLNGYIHIHSYYYSYLYADAHPQIPIEQLFTIYINCSLQRV